MFRKFNSKRENKPKIICDPKILGIQSVKELDTSVVDLSSSRIEFLVNSGTILDFVDIETIGQYSLTDLSDPNIMAEVKSTIQSATAQAGLNQVGGGSGDFQDSHSTTLTNVTQPQALVISKANMLPPAVAEVSTTVTETFTPDEGEMDKAVTEINSDKSSLMQEVLSTPDSGFKVDKEETESAIQLSDYPFYMEIFKYVEENLPYLKNADEGVFYNRGENKDEQAEEELSNVAKVVLGKDVADFRHYVCLLLGFKLSSKKTARAVQLLTKYLENDNLSTPAEEELKDDASKNQDEDKEAMDNLDDNSSSNIKNVIGSENSQTVGDKDKMGGVFSSVSTEVSTSESKENECKNAMNEAFLKEGQNLATSSAIQPLTSVKDVTSLVDDSSIKVFEVDLEEEGGDEAIANDGTGSEKEKPNQLGNQLADTKENDTLLYQQSYPSNNGLKANTVFTISSTHSESEQSGSNDSDQEERCNFEEDLETLYKRCDNLYDGQSRLDARLDDTVKALNTSIESIMSKVTQLEEQQVKREKSHKIEIASLQSVNKDLQRQSEALRNDLSKMVVSQPNIISTPMHVESMIFTNTQKDNSMKKAGPSSKPASLNANSDVLTNKKKVTSNALTAALLNNRGFINRMKSKKISEPIKTDVKNIPSTSRSTLHQTSGDASTIERPPISALEALKNTQKENYVSEQEPETTSRDRKDRFL